MTMIIQINLDEDSQDIDKIISDKGSAAQKATKIAQDVTQKATGESTETDTSHWYNPFSWGHSPDKGSAAQKATGESTETDTWHWYNPFSWGGTTTLNALYVGDLIIGCITLASLALNRFSQNFQNNNKAQAVNTFLCKAAGWGLTATFMLLLESLLNKVLPSIGVNAEMIPSKSAQNDNSFVIPTHNNIKEQHKHNLEGIGKKVEEINAKDNIKALFPKDQTKVDTTAEKTDTQKTVGEGADITHSIIVEKVIRGGTETDTEHLAIKEKATGGNVVSDTWHWYNPTTWFSGSSDDQKVAVKASLETASVVEQTNADMAQSSPNDHPDNNALVENNITTSQDAVFA